MDDDGIREFRCMVCGYPQIYTKGSHPLEYNGAKICSECATFTKFEKKMIQSLSNKYSHCSGCCPNSYDEVD